MPRFDGTGPAGQGPMTGRGMGPCNPNPYYGQSPIPPIDPYIQMYGRPRWGLRGGGRGRSGRGSGFFPY